MDDKSSKIKERVLQIAELKGIAKEKFFESIGMSYGNFKGRSKTTPLNSNAIADIMTMLPDINLGWLVLGVGEMLNDQGNISNEVVSDISNENDDYREKYIEVLEKNMKLHEEIQRLMELLQTSEKALFTKPKPYAVAEDDPEKLQKHSK